MYRIFLAVFLLACLATPATAQESLDLDAIRTQQAEIRTGVQAKSGPYKDMPESTRADLLSKQHFVLTTIEGKQTADELSRTQQMEVFNALEWIEAAINNAEDERMVCRVEKEIGSHRHIRICKTVAQRRKEQEAARSMMNNAQRCVSSECISTK